MRSLEEREAIEWCATANLKPKSDGLLRYPGNGANRFFLTAPEEHREIVVLATDIASFRGPSDFYGGLIWLRRWDIGSPRLVETGWSVLENIRRAHGDLRPLDLAPAQFFRSDEPTELRSFLIQVIAYGWVAEYVPCSGRLFYHFKDNRQVCVTSEHAEASAEVRTHFQEWNPTDEDPMGLKMRAPEPARKAKKKPK